MKLKSILMVAAVALLASCSNPESLLQKYEAACEKGNAVKAAQILEQMSEKYPNDTDWTEEQIERIEDASLTLTEKATEDALNALGAMGDLF
jgi:hypothetical protein